MIFYFNYYFINLQTQIGGLLQIIYGHFSCTLMSPFAMVEYPLRWIQAVSDYKGTTSGGPNFSYDLCVKYFNALNADEQREMSSKWDLSSWDIAFSGAEPIRVETMEKFYE